MSSLLVRELLILEDNAEIICNCFGPVTITSPCVTEDLLDLSCVLQRAQSSLEKNEAVAGVMTSCQKGHPHMRDLVMILHKGFEWQL